VEPADAGEGEKTHDRSFPFSLCLIPRLSRLASSASISFFCMFAPVAADFFGGGGGIALGFFIGGGGGGGGGGIALGFFFGGGEGGVALGFLPNPRIFMID